MCGHGTNKSSFRTKKNLATAFEKLLESHSFDAVTVKNSSMSATIRDKHFIATLPINMISFFGYIKKWFRTLCSE